AKIITPAADCIRWAGAAADDQEEGVLDSAVQPDDARQPAENLALSALAQDGKVAAGRQRGGCRNTCGASNRRAAHSVRLMPCGTHSSHAVSPRRAARSFSTNWAALTT